MPARRKKKIFIVDDDASVRNSLKRFFTKSGFKTAAFESVDDFLAVVDARTTGFLILDVHMPGTSGLTLQSRLHELKVNLPTVFITADRCEKTEERAVQMGAVAYLQKPFTQKQLMDSMRDFCFETE